MSASSPPQQQASAEAAAARQRRQVKLPSRFEDEDVFWDLGPLQPRRYVYRLLKRRDIRRDLLNREVFLFWPEDSIWYRAMVEEVDPKTTRIYVHYVEDDQYEEIVAADLVAAHHIAVKEQRPIGAPLSRGDIPVDAEDRANAVYLDEPSSEDGADAADNGDEYRASEDDSARRSEDEEFDATDSDEERRLRAARLKAAAARAAALRGHAQVNRGSKRFAAEQEASGAKKAKATATGVRQHPQQPVSEVQAAEDFKAAVLGALIHQFEQPAGRTGSTKLARAPSGQQARHGGALNASSDAQEASLRDRARQQLASALAVAAEELKREGIVDERGTASPTDVGGAVEAALYDTYGGLSREYKTRFRSLVFNLKDAANPELRARVLQGELPPAKLVMLSAAELASREVSAARARKAEKMARAKFLDEETAAKFSTAAAAALKDAHHSKLAAVSAKMLATQDIGDRVAGHGDGDDDGTARSSDPPGGATGGLLTVRSMSGGLLEQGSVGGAAAGSEGGAARTAVGATRVASVRPATVLPASTKSTAMAAAHEDEEYNPDDFIVGDEGDQGELGGSGGAPATSSRMIMAGGQKPPSTVSLPPAPLPASDPAPSSREAGAVGRRSPGSGPGPMDWAEPGSTSAAVDDLSPVVAAPLDPVDVPTPGSQVWAGRLSAPEAAGLAVELTAVGGMQAVTVIMPTHDPAAAHDVEVKGTLRLDKVEEFMEELRARSRSRTATLALLRPRDDAVPLKDGTGAEERPSASLASLITFYGGRKRAGVFHPTTGVEAYLVPPGRLAQRLLLTARLCASPAVVHLLPADVPAGQLLVAFLHRRDWRPKPQAPATAAAAPLTASPQPLAPTAPLAPLPAPALGSGPGAVSRPDDPRAARVAAAAAAGATGPGGGGGDGQGGHDVARNNKSITPPETTASALTPQTAPPPPALQSLLASLAPALQQQQQQQPPQAQSHPQPAGSPSKPPPHGLAMHAAQHVPEQMPVSQSLLGHTALHAHSAAAPAGSSLDVGALSALASALQGALPGLAQQQGTASAALAQAGGGLPPGPVVVMQPDGTYTLLGGVTGRDGMPSMLVLPPDAPAPAATPVHAPPGPPPPPPPAAGREPHYPSWERERRDHGPPNPYSRGPPSSQYYDRGPGGPRPPPPPHWYDGRRGPPPPGHPDYPPPHPPPSYRPSYPPPHDPHYPPPRGGRR